MATAIYIAGLMISEGLGLTIQEKYGWVIVGLFFAFVIYDLTALGKRN